MEFPDYDFNLSPEENTNKFLADLKDYYNQNVEPPMDDRVKEVGDRVIVMDYSYNKLEDGTIFKLDDVKLDDLPYCCEGIVIATDQEETNTVALGYATTPGGSFNITAKVLLDTLVYLENGVKMYLPSPVLMRIDDSHI